MTQVWDENNRLVPVTVIEAGPNVVAQVRTRRDGYAAVQLGYGAIDPRKVTQPLSGHFEKAGVTRVVTSSSCAPPMRGSTPSGRSSRPTHSRPGRSWTSPKGRRRARASPAS